MQRKQGSYLTKKDLNEIKWLKAIRENQKIKKRNVGLPKIPEFPEFVSQNNVNDKRMKSLNYLNLNKKRTDIRIRNEIVYYIIQGNNIYIATKKPNGTINTRLGYIKLI